MLNKVVIYAHLFASHFFKDYHPDLVAVILKLGALEVLANLGLQLGPFRLEDPAHQVDQVSQLITFTWNEISILKKQKTKKHHHFGVGNIQQLCNMFFFFQFNYLKKMNLWKKKTMTEYHFLL